ncbi:MAG: hypothetical protein K2W95_22675 [Candidatus Obscuribacterales bacterium]|nr:hypothetical protein [Candidatus Obscuribacterales bacterium]
MDQGTLIALLAFEGGLLWLGALAATKVKKRKKGRAKTGVSRQEQVVDGINGARARQLVRDFFYKRPSRLVLGMHVPLSLRRRWWHVTSDSRGVLHAKLDLPDCGASMDVLVSVEGMAGRSTGVIVRFVWNLEGGVTALEPMKEIARFTSKCLLEHLNLKVQQLKPPAPPPLSDSDRRRTATMPSYGSATSRDWPSPQAYNEAVQTPRICFSDSDLANCQPELTNLGIPRVVSGGFANVYRLRSDEHQIDMAVRCFVAPVKDQQERYRAISSFLLGSDLRCTVSFEYLEEGIAVGGQWFPVLKMDWVDGLPLNTFVDQNLLNRTRLADLRYKFQAMMDSMRAWGIAHGDLQHGNIMVCDGELFLVDYDAMFVPALAGYASNELGHSNYQHPLRTGSDFGPWLDNFSAWIIDTALLCLLHDPSLWNTFNGDESLLFRQTDFANPEKSQLLSVLQDHEVDAIRERGAMLKQYLAVRPQLVPPFGFVENAQTELVGRTPVPKVLPESPARSGSPLPDWMVDDGA